jgi:hypothetical protein
MRKIILAMLMLLPPSLAVAGEAEIRDELAAQGKEFFLAERFSDLDYLAGEYLGNESRTLSGQWMIEKLHTGILSTVPCACKDEEEIIEMEQRAARWIAANPDSPTAHLVYAEALRKHGWWFRGNGYAKDVRPDAWKPFREYLEAARSYLMERKEMLANDPRWYSVMLRLANGQSWPIEDFSGLLQEAAERHPYYYMIYYEAISYLSPKWHGNAALLEGMANFAVSMTQDEEGEAIYARIYWSAADVQFGHGLVSGQPEVWATMRQGFYDMLEDYPDQWNIINFARYSCVARDKELAAELFPAIDENLVTRAWGTRGPDYAQCREWARGI